MTFERKTFYHISTYKETLSSFIRLFSLMIQIVLLFGTIYFVMQTMTAEEKIKENDEITSNQRIYPLDNVNTLCYYEIFKNKPDKLKILYNALLAYQDAYTSAWLLLPL